MGEAGLLTLWGENIKASPQFKGEALMFPNTLLLASLSSLASQSLNWVFSHITPAKAL
jgi:hypothetical protein